MMEQNQDFVKIWKMAEMAERRIQHLLFVPQFGENDKEMHPAIRVPVIRHSGSDEGGTDGVLAELGKSVTDLIESMNMELAS